ncbi:MAG: hypothetical protein U0270_15285 [Labilithrix sp.]
MDPRRLISTKSWLLGGALGAFALAAGCSSGPDDASATSGANLGAPQDPATELAELDKVLGNDRVGRAFHANPSAISSKLPDFESLFGVGRACDNPASKEIFIVEEKSTRFGGRQQDTLDLLPRAVIGGCKTPGITSHLQSFELMVAAVSDKSYSLDDPFSVEPVEAMALDETTGLFNFYIIERPEPLHPHDRATVTRFIRRADGQIERLQKVANRPATIEVSTNRKCFDCHINGGPVMNELTQPWSGWVSSSGLYSRSSVTGITRELVSESRPFSHEHDRSSLANDLEKITREAIATWIEGLPGRPGSGVGPQTLSGQQPGGVSGLLKSVFCQTELNFASAFDTVPIQLFVDEFAGQFAALEPPINSLSLPHFPVRLPVRSEVDKRIEIFLQKKGLIGPDTVLATRLVDDEHDIFSTKRCGLYSSVVERIAAGATPDAAVRAAIKTTLSSTPNARERLIAALLDPKTPDDVRSQAESDYIADLTARYQADIVKVESDEGLRELDGRLAERQRAAQAMFPSTANVLPRLEHVPSIFLPDPTP